MTITSFSSPTPEPPVKTLGILGGMGPLASAAFLQKVLEYIPAGKDSDYPRIILDSHTGLPSRSRAYLYGEESPLPGMIEACRQLEQYGVECIALPCNSASAWLKELQLALAAPVLNIFQAVAGNLRSAFTPGRPVVVLGAAATWGLDSYKSYVEEAGFSYHKPDEKLQKRIEALISSAKLLYQRGSLDTLYHECRNILHCLCNDVNGQPIFILGCTEFGLLADKFDHQDNKNNSIYYNVVDSLTAYARQTAKLCVIQETEQHTWCTGIGAEHHG